MTNCQSGTSRVDRKVKFGTVSNTDMANSNMTSLFEIDTFLINYSLIMTNCQSDTSRVGRKVKFGTMTNTEMKNSNKK